MASIADMARDYGSLEEWKPASPLHEMLAKIAGGMKGVNEWVGRGRGGKQVSSNPMNFVWGDLPEAVDRLAYGQRLDPTHYLDLAGAAPFVGKAAGMAGRGAADFAKHIDLGAFATHPPGSPMAQAGKVSIKGDTRPKVMRRLEDEFATPEAAAQAAMTPVEAQKAEKAAARAAEEAEASKSWPVDKRSTVMRSQRTAYPGIYDDPRELVARAKVADEDPALKELFNVNRDDIWQISEEGRRKGNMEDVPYRTAKNPKGAAAVEDITNPRNTRRVENIIEAARDRPELFNPMASWYVMDPAYQRLVELVGKERAPELYRKFNAMTGMASPGSEVLTEINRGTMALKLANEGRFGDFEKYGGVKLAKRGKDFPEDMQNIIPHPYHPTAQAGPMRKFVDSGELDMNSAKVPSYIGASGVPETGFQTAFPVGDAHFSRLVGLPDVRGWKRSKEGSLIPNAASASVPEMVGLTPWFRALAHRQELEAVPGQAVVWGGGSNATGVTSPIGAGKLELLAMQIKKAAKREGIPATEMRDRVLLGKAQAGEIDPKLLAMIGGGSGAAAALTAAMADE